MQRRQREAGSWVIDEDPLGEGDGWQDWPAFHRVATTDRAPDPVPGHAAGRDRHRAGQDPPGRRARVPDHVPAGERPAAAPAGHGRQRPRRRAWSTRSTSGSSGSTCGWPTTPGSVSAEEQLSLLRQVAEAVAYAHGNRVVHRGLTPHAVWVRRPADGDPRVLVGDWQSAGTVAGPALTGLSGSGVTGLMGASRTVSRVSRAERGDSPAGARWTWTGGWPRRSRHRKASGTRTRTGSGSTCSRSARWPTTCWPASPAAADRAALRERLHRDSGLDLAADLPQVPSAVRALVLEATRPAVTERLPDVRSFLDRLDEAETSPGRARRGRDRPAGSRARVRSSTAGSGCERRLGTGSTAVGPARHRPRGRRVRPGRRPGAQGRASTTRRPAGSPTRPRCSPGCADPRLVRLVEGPIDVGGRQALVLESAGDETLGEVLRGRERLSLDLLERWGTDLLEALVALDRAGVDHRDIKPANLGVRERPQRPGQAPGAVRLLAVPGRRDRRHGGHAAVPGPVPRRPRARPVRLGRGTLLGRRRAVRDGDRVGAPVRRRAVRPGVGPGRGDRRARHVRPGRRRAAGRVLPHRAGPRAPRSGTTRPPRCWPPGSPSSRRCPRPIPDDADDLRRQGASRPRRWPQAGPVRPCAVRAGAASASATVGDLVAVDPVRLNRLSGVADGDPPRGQGPGQRSGGTASAPPSPAAAQAASRSGQAGHPGSCPIRSRRPGCSLEHAGQRARRVTAGHGPAAARPRPRPRPVRHPDRAGRRRSASPGPGWPSRSARCRTRWADRRRRAATCSTPSRRPPGSRWPTSAASPRWTSWPAPSSPHLPPADSRTRMPRRGRIAAGLLRLALDRAQALQPGRRRAGAGLSSRRRDGRIVLLAADPALLDPAEALGRAADDLVAQAPAAGEPLVPAARAAQRLQDVWTRAGARPEPPSPGSATGGCCGWPPRWPGTPPCPGRTSCTTADLPATDALALALAGVGGTQAVTAHEIRDRVRARFPALPPLPDRPRLDQLIDDAGLGLVYDEAEHGYRWPTRAAGHQGPGLPAGHRHRAAGPAAGQRRPVRAPAGRERGTRSFLALGVDADRADRAVDALTGRFGATVVDVTQVLIDAMRAQAAEVGLPLGHGPGRGRRPGGQPGRGRARRPGPAQPARRRGRDHRGAGRRTRRDAARSLLTEIAPLARYGHLAMLSPVDRPGDPPPAGHLGARPATARHARRHRRQAPAAARRPRPVLPPRRRVDRPPGPPSPPPKENR